MTHSGLSPEDVAEMNGGKSLSPKFLNENGLPDRDHPKLHPALKLYGGPSILTISAAVPAAPRRVGRGYLGEPTPFVGGHDPSRSSYFGIVDLAGFKKDRFYLYQAHWRPELPMAHILPHWNWPERVGQVTPVFVYTSGDEAELFLNAKSLGRKKKAPYTYRLRWNDVVYEPGELHVVAYKQGQHWAEDTVTTTGPESKILLQPDRTKIAPDGLDLSYVTVTIADQDGLQVPRSKNLVKLSVSGAGELVAVDNGDATSLQSFQASEIKAFNGRCLAIIRAKPDQVAPDPPPRRSGWATGG